MRKSMCLLLVLLLLTSCGIANKESSPSPQDKQSAKSLSSQGNQGVQNLSGEGATAAPIPYSQPGQPSDGRGESDVVLKDHFERLAKRVPGVKGAHCVVMNNVAVVGIDVDGSLTRSRVGSIKYSVAEAIRKDPRSKDPRSVKAFVTADMDISSRLAEMGKHISKGHPVSGFASEMADIIGRIIPQLPKDTKPKGNQ
ncbi:sporulation protein [Paenibacillus helianthi]|uniref:Sporulation protein n=1 Tax=Paenibacillus helianthi TaxID=1349432 RepID=A0ABX3EXB6_9BACL|nr:MULTISPECIES: YhcN/YlaJ family sporulation lipoprotein [Paenibacillus]OKP69510.1 sporulation protein [Paenibacillus sp. P3E]OKP89932.1 sporulation protein [Paenibacillus sp. P32E]OKP91126.1 sporulation protein [Paenibacillus helianthi]